MHHSQSNLPLSVPIQSGHDIWNNTQLPGPSGQRMEFPHLIRFGGYWYCGFRHGVVHDSDLSGKGMIIRSKDGCKWELAVHLSHPGADVRDPRLSVTGDGRLMVNAALSFVPPQQTDTASTAAVRPLYRRSVTWLSDDGETWDGPYGVESAVETWRWDVTWHDGCGYSVGYSGEDALGTLYKTADGKSWEPVVSRLFPARRGNEAALTFTATGEAYCLLRAGGGGRAALGVAHEPFTEWQWSELDVIWQRQEPRQPLYAVMSHDLGGPHLITASSGQVLGVARVTGTNGNPSGATLFMVDSDSSTLVRLATVDGGGSYPGLVEYDGSLWMTCVHIDENNEQDWRIRLLKLPISGDVRVEVPDPEPSPLASGDLTQSDLAKLAGSPDRHVRLAVASNLSDPDVLSSMAINDPSWTVRLTAQERCDGAVRWGEWYAKPDPHDQGLAEGWESGHAVGDRGWSVIPCPSMWANTFLEDYLGVAWYGVEFDVSGDASFTSLKLAFSGVDSEATVFVNGQLVGERTIQSTGQPPEVIWDEPFSVLVDSKVLTNDRPNILYVRVRSGPINGGIHQPVLATLV